jgi:hypothetical protein
MSKPRGKEAYKLTLDSVARGDEIVEAAIAVQFAAQVLKRCGLLECLAHPPGSGQAGTFRRQCRRFALQSDCSFFLNL